MLRIQNLRGCAVGLCALAPAAGVSAGVLLEESLGNFPDAVEIKTLFGTFTDLSINGDLINGTGFLFSVSNTSWGDGASSSFAQDPDGHFAVDDTITPAASAAIGGAQSFGLFAFGAHLPTGSGVVTSAPDGFAVNIEPDNDHPPGVAVEVNFEIASADGLLFDRNATGIEAIFTNPRTGKLAFFISTPTANILDNLLAEDDGLPAVDVMTSLAWAEVGEIAARFNAPGETFNDSRLRPRGEMVLVPEPGVLVLLVGGGLLGRRRSGRRA